MITLGSDPELFAHDGKNVVPAYFALGGDVDVALPYGSAYCDGAAVEFTVAPSDDAREFVNNLKTNLLAIQEHMWSRGFEPSLISNAFIEPRYIESLPERFGKRASLQILGCSADARVYPWVDDVPRPDPKTYPYRTIGCHIHVAIGEMITQWPYVQFTTAFLDAALGTAGIYVLGDDEPAKLRNILYGKSGTIRVKDAYQAIEYRTLPSQAVCASEQCARTFFSLAQETARVAEGIFKEGGYGLMRDVLGGIEQMHQLVDAIDSHDVETCRQLQQSFSDRVGNILDMSTFAALIHDSQNLSVLPDYKMEWKQ